MDVPAKPAQPASAAEPGPAAAGPAPLPVDGVGGGTAAGEVAAAEPLAPPADEAEETVGLPALDWLSEAVALGKTPVAAEPLLPPPLPAKSPPELPIAEALEAPPELPIAEIAAEPAGAEALPPPLPAAARPPSQPTAQWYLKTDDGEQYGPVPKTELDAWYYDGRIDATCQLRSEEAVDWMPAEQVYPELAEARAPSTTGSLTGQPAWKALELHCRTVRHAHLRELFAADPGRGERMTAEA
ncbi:MAG: GYF domain-containing protein, partial [Thermoguttaceae bacterium]